MTASTSFRFRLNNPTLDQQNAGYIKGEYIFTFQPPGTDPTQFGGTVNDPWKKPDDDRRQLDGRRPRSRSNRPIAGL